MRSGSLNTCASSVCVATRVWLRSLLRTFGRYPRMALVFFAEILVAACNSDPGVRLVRLGQPEPRVQPTCVKTVPIVGAAGARLRELEATARRKKVEPYELDSLTRTMSFYARSMSGDAHPDARLAYLGLQLQPLAEVGNGDSSRVVATLAVSGGRPPNDAAAATDALLADRLAAYVGRQLLGLDLTCWTRQ